MFLQLLVSLLLLQIYEATVQSDPISYTFLKLLREASREIDETVNERILEKLDSFSMDAYEQSESVRSGQLDHQETGPRPHVAVKNGLITGETISGSHAFYSIPYGKAPVGALR